MVHNVKTDCLNQKIQVVGTFRESRTDLRVGKVEPLEYLRHNDDRHENE